MPLVPQVMHMLSSCFGSMFNVSLFEGGVCVCVCAMRAQLCLALFHPNVNISSMWHHSADCLAVQNLNAILKTSTPIFLSQTAFFNVQICNVYWKIHARNIAHRACLCACGRSQRCRRAREVDPRLRGNDPAAHPPTPGRKPCMCFYKYLSVSVCVFNPFNSDTIKPIELWGFGFNAC